MRSCWRLFSGRSACFWNWLKMRNCGHARPRPPRLNNLHRMQAPKVSVGFPVYNGEKYLANALGELTSQEYENFDLIIADNASTDRTEEICREFAARDQRIRYLRNPRNIGLAANHNLTVELARGEFFKWAAHDDGFPPAMLRRLVDVLQSAPKSVCVAYSFCEYIDQNGNVIGMDSDGVALDDSRPHKRLSHLLWRVHMFNCPYGLMRTEVLRQTRLHGLFPMADHVLMAELAMLGVLVEVPEPLLRI